MDFEFTAKRIPHDTLVRGWVLKNGDSLEDFEEYEIVKPPVLTSECGYNGMPQAYTCFIDKCGKEYHYFVEDEANEMLDIMFEGKYAAIVRHVKPTLVFLKEGQEMPEGKVLLPPTNVNGTFSFLWSYIGNYKSFIGTDGKEHGRRSVAALEKSKKECLFIAIIERD